MTSFAPTSLCAIRPSGETLDFVRPGMSRVVARTFGVLEPEFVRGSLLRQLDTAQLKQRRPLLTLAGYLAR